MLLLWISMVSKNTYREREREEAVSTNYWCNNDTAHTSSSPLNSPEAPLYHWPPPNDWAPRQCPGHNPGYSIAWQGCLASPSYPPEQLRDSVLSSYPLACWYNICVITIIKLIDYTAPSKYPPHAGRKPVYIKCLLGLKVPICNDYSTDPMTQATIHPPLCTNNSDWLYIHHLVTQYSDLVWRFFVRIARVITI